MPPELAAQLDAVQTVVIGEPGMNPADPGAPMPCEYAVTASALYPGRPCFHVLVELTEAERQQLADGGRLLLTLDGAEVPWRLDVQP